MKTATRRSGICPACGSEGVYRSHTHGWERLLKVLSVRWYRCPACNTRFRRYTHLWRGLLLAALGLAGLALLVVMLWNALDLASQLLLGW